MNDNFPVQKSDEEWEKELPAEKFHVLRKKGTERAFTGEFNDFYKDGVFLCAACQNPLFDSKTKYNSGSGWPSFYAPIAKEKITEVSDQSFGMIRTEVVCANCGSHLGHLFDDGPEPTGLRYCLNSASLDFRDREETDDLK